MEIGNEANTEWRLEMRLQSGDWERGYQLLLCQANGTAHVASWSISLKGSSSLPSHNKTQLTGSLINYNYTLGGCFLN